MEKFIRVMGSKTPKNRMAYAMRFQLINAAQYLRGAAADEVVEMQWHRNQREATLSGWQQDTRKGSALGWAFVGATPIK